MRDSGHCGTPLEQWSHEVMKSMFYYSIPSLSTICMECTLSCGFKLLQVFNQSRFLSDPNFNLAKARRVKEPPPRSWSWRKPSAVALDLQKFWKVCTVPLRKVSGCFCQSEIPNPSGHKIQDLRIWIKIFNHLALRRFPCFIVLQIPSIHGQKAL